MSLEGQKLTKKFDHQKKFYKNIYNEASVWCLLKENVILTRYSNDGR